MIYLKNNTETQTIYIPRQTVLGGGYIPSTKAYEKGYNDGFEDGKEQQKEKLSNLYVTENGQYEREDGWNVVTVDVPDLNGSYEEGYNQGYAEGIDEQKGKLESINITENGVYSKEDGYNHIEVNVPNLNGDYNEGYEQGQADVAANARVLEVTENGNYLSKFSDPILPTVTGVYADGTDFYNYAYLEGISYDSGFIVSEDMEVEIWWKGDVSKTDKNLFGSQVNNLYAIFKIRIPDTAYCFEGEIAMRQVTYRNAESNRWYHFKISYADGFWVDGVKIGDFSSNISGTPDKLYINSHTPYSFNGVNGYFGMIKITTNGVENIIIPTAEGLKNITTDEMLQVVQNGNYTFTENLPIYPEGELYKTINVNVPQEVVSCNLEDKQVTPSMSERDDNGLIVVNPSEGYDGLSRTVIDPQNIYNEGVEAGRAEGGESSDCNLISPIVFSKDAGDTINAESVQIPTFVYEGNQYYNVDDFNLADIEEFKIQILFKPNNSGDSEPISIFGCEDTDWDVTTFGARIYQGQIYFRMSGQDVASPYTKNAWYDVEMGYNASKRWVIVNGETLLETEHTVLNRPNQTLMIGAINSGGNALRPFYGKIATIYIESNGNQVYLLPKEDGTMDVYWNSKNGRWISKSGDNNARFENEYMSGDGMKSITWLGNLEDKWVTPSMSERDDNGYIIVEASEGYSGLKRTVINPQTIYNEGLEAGRAECVCPSVQEQSFDYDITAFAYKVYDWTSVNINRDNMTNDCGDRPLDCLLLRNRNGECTVMTKLDNCSGIVRLENGWSGDSIILSLKSNTITKFSSNSINSNQLESIDTGLAQLEENAIMNCNALTDIKVTANNNDLSNQFATNCFNGLPAEGTITIGKNVDVTITDDEITSFFRTIVGEGWTITIK